MLLLVNTPCNCNNTDCVYSCGRLNSSAFFEWYINFTILIGGVVPAFLELCMFELHFLDLDFRNKTFSTTGTCSTRKTIVLQKFDCLYDGIKVRRKLVAHLNQIVKRGDFTKRTILEGFLTFHEHIHFFFFY